MIFDRWHVGSFLMSSGGKTMRIWMASENMSLLSSEWDAGTAQALLLPRTMNQDGQAQTDRGGRSRY